MCFFSVAPLFVCSAFFCYLFRSSIFHWRDSVDCFFKTIFRFSVVRKGIEIFFLCASSSSFSSHFNCYYCHGGFKWHAKMQAKTKDKVYFFTKNVLFVRYRHAVSRLAFPSFVIPAIFIYHCFAAVIKHILHHNFFSTFQTIS